MNFNQRDFITWESRSRDAIDVKRCYIDVAEDLIAGILLSQIVYWHLPSRNGETKLQVKRDGHEWLAKAREEWWEECRITPKQFDRAISILEGRELVVTANFRFNGNKTKHVRINWPVFIQRLEDLPDSPVGKFRTRSRSSLLGDSVGFDLMEIPEFPIREDGEFPIRKNDLYSLDYTETTYIEKKNSLEKEKFQVGVGGVVEEKPDGSEVINDPDGFPRNSEPPEVDQKRSLDLAAQPERQKPLKSHNIGQPSTAQPEDRRSDKTTPAISPKKEKPRDVTAELFNQGLPPWKDVTGKIDRDFEAYVISAYPKDWATKPPLVWARDKLRDPGTASDYWEAYQAHLKQKAEHDRMLKEAGYVETEILPFGPPPSDRVSFLGLVNPVTPAQKRKLMELRGSNVG